MKRYIIYMLALAAFAACSSSSGAQSAEVPQGSLAVQAVVVDVDPDGGERFGDVVFDKTVHNFGEVLTTDGPQSCSFVLTNEGDKSIAIYEVVSSCGCTNVTWTKGPIRPGESGVISATYDNADGPITFDKTLTVYVSGIRKPVILHLRGVVREKAVPLADAYPLRMAGGKLGLKTAEMNVGNILQGQSRSDEILVANLSDSPLNLSFTDVSEGLFLRLYPNPLPPKETGALRATVLSDPSRWGMQTYSATLDGDGKLLVQGYTMEDFSGWSDEEMARAPYPEPDETTVDFGVVPIGSVVKGRYRIVNTGKTPLVFHAADPDHAGGSCSGWKEPVQPGKAVTLEVRYDTKGEPEGENLMFVTLTTNAPERPILHLFLGGALKK